MLSLKQIGTICLSILIPTFSVFATPDIASNSNGNGSCVEPVLHRYDGSANLQAGWQANTIQLKWYNGDQQLNVQSAANSCTYDGALTLPSTQPTKTGYTFAGWKVKTAAASGGLCGLTSSMMEMMPNMGYFHTYNIIPGASEGAEYCKSVQTPVIATSAYENISCSGTGLNLYEWKLEFSYGIYKGVASCNNTPGPDYSALIAQFQAGTITEEEAMVQFAALQEEQGYRPAGSMNSNSTGGYCWCHAESYTPNGGSACSLSSVPWVFANGDRIDDPANCAEFCVSDCVSRFGSGPVRVLLGVLND